MAKLRPMDEEELRALIGAEIRTSLGFLGSDLSAQRAEAMKRYLGEPYGDEQEDRSQIVSSDVADTIEWILPSLLKIFAAGDDVVSFAPQGPEDEEVAKQATEYCNWIFLRDNPGFLILYTWFKDALLQKNGIVKTWWEEIDSKKKERYQGLTDDAFALLMRDVEEGDVEIVAHSEYPDPLAAVSQPPPAGPAAGEAAPSPPVPAAAAQPMLHDVVVERSKNYGCVKVEAVPPEEFLISKDAKDIQNARFVAHRVRRTRSQLIEMGYDKDQVQNLGSDGRHVLVTEEEIERYSTQDQSRPSSIASASLNEQMREIWVVECYLKVDYDGDGIAERRKITVAGTGWEVLKWAKDAPDDKSGPDNEEWEGPVPFASLTPIIMPHVFFGRSIADTIQDLARIKTVLTRQLLDAMYLANNPRYEVFEDAIVEPSELLSAKPGGYVRKSIEGPAVTPLVTQDITGTALQGLEYVDSSLENRTGVTKYNQGLDADSLNKTATGVSQIMSASQQRVELIARVFAETGVKELFRLILWLVTAHQNEPRIIRLREQWVPMDPREWDSEMDVTINVGLGTGNKEQQAALLNQLLMIQQNIVTLQGGVQGPLVTAENVYKTLERFISAAGIAKNAEGFFTDPATAPPEPPKPDPEQQKAQMQMQQMQMQAQLDQQKAANDLQMQREGMALKQQQAIFDMQIQKQQAEQAMALERAKFQMQMEHDSAKAQMQMQHDDAMAQVNLRTTQLMGEQKLDHAAQAAAQKTQAMKQQAKAKKPGA